MFSARIRIWDWLGRGTGEPFEMIEMFCFLILVVLMLVYMFVRTFLMVHLKWVYFIVHILYLNRGFAGGWVVKNLPAMQETWVRSLVEKIQGRRKWQPTALFLPGKSLGQRRLAGYSPWGCRRVRHGLAAKQQQSSLKEKYQAGTVLL